MSDNPTDPTKWQDEPEMGAQEMDDPTLEEPTADELDDPELNAAEAEAEDVELGADVELDAEDSPPIEPGADGPEGTGIEGADDELLDAQGLESENDAPDVSEEFSTDSSPAAEQGNRRSDHMIADDGGED